MTLDSIAEWKARWWLHCDKNKDRSFYKYAVDVLSGWAYYTPMYAIQELNIGQDVDTVAQTRMVGMLAHAAVMRPIGKMRNSLAKKLNVTKESSLFEQINVNIQSTMPIQAAVYAGMLGTGMLLSGSQDYHAAAYSWAFGIVSGSVHAVFHGNAQDAVRSLFGIEKAIETQENIEKKAKQQTLKL